jgi:trehalose 6-phosphate synthase
VAAADGTWVAHGADEADRAAVVERDGLPVPPSRPSYRLRYVWLTREEQRGYYDGFANEALWPLCHDADVSPVFRQSDFTTYESVNRRFTAAVAEEAGDSAPAILVQDYHFALAPRMLRTFLPFTPISTFWHIPWPSRQVFLTCPWSRELLDGLLGSNVLGFQTDEDCRNFMTCAETLPGATADSGLRTVAYRGRTVRVQAYPVGVEWGNRIAQNTPSPVVCRQLVDHALQLPPDARLGIGIDRLDYTKGINHKFLALERLFEVRPDLRGRFVFVQIAEPSRDSLPAYRSARRQLLETAARVNDRFGTGTYQPIRVLQAHYDAPDVYRLYRAADLCYVGSLHDGMNLVSKEFVCARDDERGVLVLSRRAGAAQQLRAALLIDPRDVNECSAAVARALDMSDIEQMKRMRLLRDNVEAFSAQWWSRRILEDVARGTLRHPGAAIRSSSMDQRAFA